MTLPTETMEERFKKKFTNIGTLVVPSDVPVRFVEKEKEVLEFIQLELSLSQNRILEEVLNSVYLVLLERNIDNRLEIIKEIETRYER